MRLGKMITVNNEELYKTRRMDDNVHPVRHHTTRRHNPFLRRVVVRRHDPASTELLQRPRNDVQHEVSADSSNDTVRDVVRERNHDDRNERWHGVPNVGPVDLSHAKRAKPIWISSEQQNTTRQITYLEIIRLPTMTSAPPVAQPGIEAKMGEKNTETRNMIAVKIAVKPVFPPSEIPVALSMNAVTGLTPSRAPILMEKASTQYATVERSKSSVMGSRRLANLAIE